MILVIGERSDPVIAGLLAVLRQDRRQHALLDTSTASAVDLHAPASPGAGPWRVRCNEGQGRRPVGAIFVRPGRRVPAGRVRQALALWAKIDHLLLDARCPVMNRPADAAGNFAKAQQLQQLAAAGLTVPRTCVTSLPQAAARFIVDHGGNVLTKGLSSVKTVPQAVGPAFVARLDDIRQCPVQLQEIIEGREMRLTVVGNRAIASLPRRGGGYRHADGLDELPAPVVRRCVSFVAGQGLLLGGFDLSVTASDVCCFELNATPLISHYDTLDRPVLTRVVAEHLVAHTQVSERILV